MKVAELIESRRKEWSELEGLVSELDAPVLRKRNPQRTLRFAALYRSACADLALAQAYRLPEETVQYLHQLVGKAHNVLYRSRRFRLSEWGRVLSVDLPRRLYRDVYVWVAFFVFWTGFLGAGYAAYVSPSFASSMAGEAQLASVRQMYAEAPRGREIVDGSVATGFYIQHNTSIGMQCFASGVFFGIGSLGMLSFNALLLGSIFGYMGSAPEAAHFFEFVTAHGPFELTAIVLSGGAGMRMGFSIIDTRDRERFESFRQESRRSLEVVGLAALLFSLAAFVEGLISPSSAPYFLKAGVAILSAIVLISYFVVLGAWASRYAAR